MSFEDEYAAVKAKGHPFDGMIQQAADAHGVSYDYLHRKMFYESRFKADATSPTGPRGVGQFTKATGRAYGLVTDADFFDPAKSIDAAARFTKDLVGKFGGDYLKASLAYNQGEGRLGAPQLAAYDAGDLSQITSEGRKYMDAMRAAAGDSPGIDRFPKGSASEFDGFSDTGGSDYGKFSEGISDFERRRAGTEAKPTVARTGGVDVEAFGLAQGEQRVLQKGAREMEIDSEQLNPQKGFFEGTGQASKDYLATSPLAQIYRNATVEDHDPLDWVDVHDSSSWTREDFENIRKEGVDPQFFGFIMENTKGKRAALPNAIALAKENMAYEKSIRSQGTGAQFAGGIVGAIGDPLTYTPVPGIASGRLVSNVVKQAAFSSVASVASEGLREQATGIEGHYAAAAVGGAVIGGGMGAILSRLVDRAVPAPRLDMWDGDLNKFLELHGESALPNEFGPMTTRLEARETARQLGQDDPSRMPWLPEETILNHGGVDYVPHPSEPGAVRLNDGSILSAANPLNPQTLKEFGEVSPERAARGVSLGGFTEIGYKLLRPEDETVRGIASDLFRSPTGTVSGSNGKFGVTASDAIERIQSHDNVSYNKIVEAVKEAITDVSYATAPGTRQAKYETAFRKAAEAIEDTTGTRLGQLTDGELKLVKVLQEHYNRKADLMENPAQFGNPRATSILPETRHSGSYLPNVYSDAAKVYWIRLLGGADGLQGAIKQSWLASYASRAAVKSRVDKLITEQLKKEGKAVTPENLAAAVDRYAHDKAYGISHTQDFNRSSLIDDQVDGGLVGAENNNFLEARHLFDSDMQITTADGSMFSVNDLRDFDLGHITPSYDRRVNGDIGIMAATGQDTKALKDRIAKLKVKKGSESEVQALQDAVKLLTGRSRRTPDDAFDMSIRALSDASFFAKNAYMGIQSLSEVAALVTKGHIGMLMHGVPYLKEITTAGSKLKPSQLKDMHDMVFGRELDNLIRPRRSDLVERLRNQGSSEIMAQTVGTIKFGTQELSARSPFTKLLTESSNYIADAGRQGILMDIINNVHGKTKMKGVVDALTPERLHSYSVTPEQYKGIQQLIKDHLKKKPDGSFEIINKAEFQRDPRTMDLWRIGDKVADETILRPHKLSSQDTKAFGATVKLAMQFKNFTMRSLNGRLIRGIHTAMKNGQKIDQVLQASIATGLAVATYAAMKYAQAYAMPKDQRDEFLKKSLNPNMLAYAGLSRSSHMGAPMSMANLVMAPLGVDQAAAVRSSILPRGDQKKQPKGGPMLYKPSSSDQVQGFLSRSLDQVPGAGFALSAYQVTDSAFGLGRGEGRKADQGYMQSMYNGMRNMIPNDPVTQKVFLALFEEQGMGTQ